MKSIVQGLDVAPWMSPLPCSITLSSLTILSEQTIDDGEINPTKQTSETPKQHIAKNKVGRSGYWNLKNYLNYPFMNSKRTLKNFSFKLIKKCYLSVSNPLSFEFSSNLAIKICVFFNEQFENCKIRIKLSLNFIILSV